MMKIKVVNPKILIPAITPPKKLTLLLLFFPKSNCVLSDIDSKKKPLTIVDNGGYKKINKDDIINIQIESKTLSNAPQNKTFAHETDGRAFQKENNKEDKITIDNSKDKKVNFNMLL